MVVVVGVGGAGKITDEVDIGRGKYQAAAC